MNRKLVKIFALVLAVMMLLSVVACSDPVDPVEGETTKAEETQGNTPVESGNAGSDDPDEETEEEETYQEDDLPDDLDFGNTVSILFWEDVERPEFEIEEESADAIANAIYARNNNVTEDLGIEFEWSGEKGSYSYIDTFATRVGNSFAAGDRQFDIIASYSRTTAVCGVKGYLADLNAIEDSYINLDKTWWPKNLIDNVTINDSLYFISGDISTNMLHFMYVQFCNDEMRIELQLEDPVEIAARGEWTLEKMMEMSEGVYQDLDADGAPSAGDRYGMGVESLHCDAFYIGSGMRIVEVDEDEGLRVSDDLSSDKIYNLVDTLGAWVNSADILKTGTINNFKEENSLFHQNRIYVADNHLKNVEFRYTVLPIPKYDLDQETYLTTIGNPFTLWAIMVDVDAEMASECTAVLECLGSYGYRLTTPQIFEVNMKVKYSETDSVSLMFDFVREGICHDLARIFPNQILGAQMAENISSTIMNGASWASTWRALERSYKNKVSKAADAFTAFQDR